MTATEAAIRQAQHENIFSSALRPETVAEIEAVLQRVSTTDPADAKAFGALCWAAFSALTSIHADRKVHTQYARAA